MYTPKSGTLTSGAPGDYVPKSGTISAQVPNQNTPQAQDKGAPLWMKYLFPAVGQQVGAWGGRAAGVVGGAMIPGADLTGIPEVAGGYAGGVAGAGAGSAGGTELYNLIDKAMGGKGNDNVGQSAVEGGGAQAIGGPLAKGAGMILHPIQSAGSQIGKMLAKSPAVVDIGKTIDRFVADKLPKYAQNGMGMEGKEAWQTLQPNVIDAVKSRQVMPILQNQANGAFPTQDIAGLQLPVQQAYGIKSAFQKQIGDAYSKNDVNPLIQQKKDFTSLLTKDVHNADPSIARMDTMLRALHGIENFGTQATNLLPGHVANAVRYMGGIPLKAAQWSIPQNGGWWNTINPLLGSLLNTANRTANQNQ